MTDLFKAKMKESGVEISNAICEHFDLLVLEYDVIKVQGINLR